MEKIVGIICEYNPFHKGHKLQIDKIRLEHSDATIVAIMSGNVVQRGELALIDKYKRAEIALQCGADLVLELPYPYSGSTAELFAEAGVEIAHKIGCTHLYFGTEKSTISELEAISDTLLNNQNQDKIKGIMRTEGIGYIQARDSYFSSMGISLPKGSNDMLALEYVKAIKGKKYDIEYCTIKRQGADYNDTELAEIMSASAIRKFFNQNGQFYSIPNETIEIYEDIRRGKEVIDQAAAEEFLFRYCLMTERARLSGAFDSCDEIGALIKEKALASINGCEFFEGLSSKSYTTSRIKRAILYSLFDVKHFNRTPTFSILLGANKRGRDVLNHIGEGFTILTKLVDSKKLNKDERDLFDITLRVDTLHMSFIKKGIAPSSAYDKKPIIR